MLQKDGALLIQDEVHADAKIRIGFRQLHGLIEGTTAGHHAGAGNDAALVAVDDAKVNRLRDPKIVGVDKTHLLTMRASLRQGGCDVNKESVGLSRRNGNGPFVLTCCPNGGCAIWLVIRATSIKQRRFMLKEQLAAFQRDGFLLPKGFYDVSAETNTIRKAIYDLIGNVIASNGLQIDRPPYSPDKFDAGFQELLAAIKKSGR